MNFQKFQLISIRNLKAKSYKAQTASRLKEIIHPPIRYKLPASMEQKFSYEELRECISWMSRNGAVQNFFLTPTRNMFAGKFVK